MTAPTITIYAPGTHPSTAANRFAALIPSQSIAVVSEFVLESGIVLKEVPVGFRTWGKLNSARDNSMVICHALTGSSDVEDWWGPLLGSGHAFDPTRFFIFCANVLGSPYGTASPVTINPGRTDGGRWGPEFPATVVRDDVRLQKLVLDHLGVHSIAVVIGGSMGGMAVLEWPLSTPRGYVRHIIPIATSPRHSAWGISWGEAQRQSIFSDPEFKDGWYKDGEGPDRGLSAARMAALLTYRSRDSFESRFGRKEVDSEGEGDGSSKSTLKRKGMARGTDGLPRTQAERAEAAHNDGNRTRATNGSSSSSRPISPPGLPLLPNGEPLPPPSPPLIFSAQSYLRYQGDKFVSRFDANCYIHLSRKMDSHDIGRGRSSEEMSAVPPGSVVIAISSDGLFTLSEQRELASTLPDSRLEVVDSVDGHDAFLTELECVDNLLLKQLHLRLPECYSGEPVQEIEDEEHDGFIPKKASLFGESEVDVTRW